MKAKRTTTQEQLNYILECRQSGLTVYQWCQKKGITQTAYYNWVGRLRKKGISLPCVDENSIDSTPTFNEIVKVDILSEPLASYPNEHQNTHKQSFSNLSSPTAEIHMGEASVRFFSHTDIATIEATLKCLGGRNYDR